MYNISIIIIVRVEKLKNVIRKTFGKFGKLVNEHYPVDDEGKTKGNLLLFTIESFYQVDVGCVRNLAYGNSTKHKKSWTKDGKFN